jgi:hypothetical protein
VRSASLGSTTLGTLNEAIGEGPDPPRLEFMRHTSQTAAAHFGRRAARWKCREAVSDSSASRKVSLASLSESSGTLPALSDDVPPLREVVAKRRTPSLRGTSWSSLAQSADASGRRRSSDRPDGAERGAGASFCNPKLVDLLQVEPELWCRSEGSRKPEGRVGGHGPLLIEDPSYPVGRHVKHFCERIRAHAEGGEVLLSEDLTRMDGAHAVGGHPPVRGRSNGSRGGIDR